MNGNLWWCFNNLLTKNLKDFLIIAALSISVESFFLELDNTRNICLEILDYHNEKSKHYETANKIIWLIDEMPSNYNFFGLFVLDGKLPFRIIALFSTYIVILIQFVFM
ncbi:uncharacterized protein LOC128202352 [Galleria mellonella]|uniref:Uncharacterized protein LOC128202352 n=1 Tax=Galleria mellonella TaxID=7137 RepID=A0ABM3N458_GALME|nr:uncharacterized protein LOC128202352 [Galleria mellonella]